MSFEPIENYGIIGNMQSTALVGMNGSIDFLCYPDFDSPTVFASLLDDKNGGRFRITPQLTNLRVRQLYLPETNILLTRFLAEEGVAELTDFMPIDDSGEQPNEIVRRVSVIKGNIHFSMCCQPRFNYARSQYRLETSDRCARFFPTDICPPTSEMSLGRKTGRASNTPKGYWNYNRLQFRCSLLKSNEIGEPPTRSVFATRLLLPESTREYISAA